jgi:hypothetical protein
MFINNESPEFNTNYSYKSDKVMRIINYFKRKMITHNDTTYFDKCYSVQYNNNNEDSSTIMEKYSCWSVLFIDGLVIEAKIIHNGRGKFKIIEDNYKSKYVNKIVDASDVVRCKLKPDDVDNLS